MQELSDVESRVRAVVVRLFDLSRSDAEGQLRMGNPPEWDSMGHMQLLVAIEDEFKIRFPIHQIAALITIEAIAEGVRAQNGN